MNDASNSTKKRELLESRQNNDKYHNQILAWERCVDIVSFRQFSPNIRSLSCQIYLFIHIVYPFNSSPFVWQFFLRKPNRRSMYIQSHRTTTNNETKIGILSIAKRFVRLLHCHKNFVFSTSLSAVFNYIKFFKILFAIPFSLVYTQQNWENS